MKKKESEKERRKKGVRGEKRVEGVQDLPGAGLKAGFGLLGFHFGDPRKFTRGEICCGSFGPCASNSYAHWQMLCSLIKSSLRPSSVFVSCRSLVVSCCHRHREDLSSSGSALFFPRPPRASAHREGKGNDKTVRFSVNEEPIVTSQSVSDRPARLDYK